jgi:VWFA-related protein
MFFHQPQRATLLLCLLGLSQSSQVPSDVLRTSSTAVLIDVVVRDKQGKPVTDLAADDFEIVEDGVRQQVASLTVTLGTPGPRRDTAVSRSSLPVDGSASRPPADPQGVNSVPEPAAPVITAFVFDELRPEAKALAHRAATALASTTGQRENDFFGVFQIDRGLRTVRSFTRQLEEVRAGLDQVLGMATVPADLARVGSQAAGDLSAAVSPTAGAESGGGLPTIADRKRRLEPADPGERLMVAIEQRMQESFAALQREQSAHGTITGLRAVVEALGDVRGRKSVLFFSEGLVVPDNVNPQFQTLIAVANRLNVTFYAVDAAGLRVHSKQAEISRETDVAARQGLGDLSRKQGIWTRDLERQDEVLRSNPSTGLGRLAVETGGFLVADTNDLASRAQRLDQDRRFHYMIGYMPLKAQLDGKYRRVVVKVKRKDTKVTHRSGYWAIPL